MSWTTQGNRSKLRTTRMRRRNIDYYPTLIYYFLGMGCLVLLSSANPPLHEVKVTLFGQPCLLRGPLAEGVLKEVHRVSPEQAYPSRLAIEPLRQALKRVKGTSALPPSLGPYREKLLKRLQAQVAFFEGLQAIQKTGDASAIIAVTKPYLTNSSVKGGGSGKDFEKLARQFKEISKEGPAKHESWQTQLRELYMQSIEPDPEKEFHQTIKKLNVEYACSFEENDEAD